MTAPVMVVTGGSRGIGSAIASKARENGATVAILDLVEPADPAEFWLRCDVSDADQVRDCLARVERDSGPITALVNNAGIAPPGRFDELSEEDWNRVLAINLTSVFLCSRLALAQLRASGGGSITNLGSIAGRQRSYTASAAYAAAKGGVISLTRQLAHELAPDGIRVNCVCPGLVDTDIITRNVPESRRPALTGGIPLRRLARPDEVAAAVWFLASAEASYITGAILDVNGGLY